MIEFVLRNNYFEFNIKVKPQISGTTMGTKCAPNYACVCIDEFHCVKSVLILSYSGLHFPAFELNTER